MQDRPSKIDQSIKVNNWNAESPTLPSNHQQHFFQKYAASSQPQQQEYLRRSPQFNQDINETDTNFRKIKNEQMQKLRSLKSEYQQIRKITTDYNGPKLSQSVSVRSSSIRSEQNGHASDSQSKSNTNGGFSHVGREYQIIQLEKKQLQIMLQNSMKKIEELLHNQMIHKKTIHELKLQKDTKSFAESDSTTFNKIYKKKEKQSYEQIRGLQLQRENLLSTTAGLREKVKYLQSKLSTSETELRKVLEEKRNYEELIRIQKDKFMNLQIESRREKREFEIMEKDKNAEINLLHKLRDIKESSLQKQLKNMVTSLKQQVKIKQKRYILLLQQLQNFHKDKSKEDKEQQAKIVSELLSKTTMDGQTKALQDNINSILARLNELQTKPPQHLTNDLFEDFMNVEKQEEEDGESAHKQEENRDLRQDIQGYEKKIHNLQLKISSLNQQNTSLKGQVTTLKLQNQTLQRKNKHLYQAEQMMRQQAQWIKVVQNKMFRSTSKEVHHHHSAAPRDDSAASKIEFMTMRINNLEKEVQDLNRKIQEINKEREATQDQNRNLLNKISRAQFQVKKTRDQTQMQLNLARKSHESNYNIVLRDLQNEKGQHQKALRQNSQLRKYIQENTEAARRQMQRLHFNIQKLQRQKNGFDFQMKATYNQNIQRIKGEYQGQLQRLTSSVKDLNIMNKQLQEQYNRQQYLYTQNEELRHSLKTLRIARREEYGDNSRMGGHTLGGSRMGSRVRNVESSHVDGNNNIMQTLNKHFGATNMGNSEQDIMGSISHAFS